MTMRPAQSSTAIPTVMCPVPQLSFIQEAYLLDKGLGVAVPQLLAVLRLMGKWDHGIIRQAIYLLVERHSLLRTRYPRIGELYVPVVTTGALHLEPVAAGGEFREEAEFRQLFQEFAAPEIDIEHTSSVRFGIASISPNECLLLIVLSGMVTDPLSQRVLIHDLSILLRALSSGQPVRLIPAPIQYSEFAAGERAQVSPERLLSAFHSWQNRVTSPARPSYSTGRLSDCKGTRLETVESPISAEVLAALADRSKAEQVSAFGLGLAVFSIVAGRCYGLSSISVSVPLVLRSHPTLTLLVGPFTDYTVVAIDLARKNTFRDLLWQVRGYESDLRGLHDRRVSVMKTIIPHSASSLPRIRFSSSLVFGSSSSPETRRSVQVTTGNLRLSLYAIDDTFIPMDRPMSQSPYDLSVSVEMAGRAAAVRCRYDAAQVPLSIAGATVNGFESVLAAIVRKPNAHIGDLQ